MDNAPEGEWLRLNFTMVVQNFISKDSQRCQSSLIPGMETPFLSAKDNQAWSTLPALCMSTKILGEKKAPEIHPLVENKNTTRTRQPVCVAHKL